jgi:hypothetical protein
MHFDGLALGAARAAGEVVPACVQVATTLGFPTVSSPDPRLLLTVG